MVSAKILIVDDDESSRFSTAIALRSPDNQFEYASSGAEALLKARQWQPDLILLDVRMPGIDGFEVCRQLRADPEIADTRVFLLTGLEDPKSRLDGFEAGADDFVTKPIQREETLARIQGIARLNRIRAVLEQQRMAQSFEARQVMQTASLDLEPVALRQVFEQALLTMRMAFQPILKVGNPPEIFAHELLLRTQNPNFPSPLVFLAAASTLACEERVGRAVRTHAADIFDVYPHSGPLFINVSPKELADEQLYGPDDPLNPYASRVVFELTEREALENVHNLRQCINELRRKGFRFALDDLGSGYASLNAFALIEPEFGKLDRNLIQDVDQGPKKQKIICALLALCDELNVQLIVEGVETEEESRVLASLGCDLQQGFWLGRPSLRIPGAAG
jgi:EAL domain-containing protein (putative c-di-GMP-specific phosphodiesterase class I)